jgi:predicted extracellular nuclease
MKKKIISLIIVFVGVVLISANLVIAQSEPKKLLIVEISTGNSQSASAEFVEIFNPNSTVVDLEGYKLEYKSASGPDWTNKASLTGKLGSYSRYLLSTSQLGVENSQQISSGFATTGGHLRISNGEKALDLLGWGAANLPESLASGTHMSVESLKRQTDEDGKFVDTDNNFLDFFASTKPSPSFDKYVAVSAPTTTPTPVTPPTPTSNSSTSTNSTKPTKKASYPVVLLSELFIDPKTPQTDKEDEFIEIYNPTDKEVDLTKYQIQTGSTSWRYKYEFDSKTIKPKSYLAVFPEDSGLTLSNSGAKAQILDPNGKVLDGVVYEKAKAGLSLIKIGEKWSWTDKPTPGLANIAQTSESDEENGENASSATDESGNFPVVAGATTNKDSKQEDQKSSFEEEEEKSVIDTSVLVIVGGLALLYGLYEYRQDIRSKFAKLRRYITRGRKTRPTT